MRKHARQTALSLGDVVVLIFGAAMLIAPFVVSLITNFGRPGVRGQAWRQKRARAPMRRSAAA
ncbi:MAG: hypothetical protein Q8R02_01550 [Hyphomonadaceae bacterium]|nr:hypothetical protein [Hyphomonadaceae bacterium]